MTRRLGIDRFEIAGRAVFAGGRRMRMKEVGVIEESIYQRIKAYATSRSIGKPVG
jgi:hypothetical protein